jgi:hypothetical protein
MVVTMMPTPIQVTIVVVRTQVLVGLGVAHTLFGVISTAIDHGRATHARALVKSRQPNTAKTREAV